MNSDEWELEMNHMLDTFNHQAVFSLGKIKRRFETLGRPFNEEFRRKFLKMAILRLDTSFDTVLFSVHTAQIFEFIKKESLNSLKNENDLIAVCDSEDGNHSDEKLATDPIHDSVEIQISDDMHHSTDAGCGNDASPSFEAEFNGENEDKCGAMIEIFGLNDFEKQYEIQTNADANESHTEMNEAVVAAAMEDNSQNNEKDTQTGAADLEDENDIKPFIKVEPNGNTAIELADIPMIKFDPNEGNGDAAEVHGTGESSNTQQTNKSTNIGSHQLKLSSANRKDFKCDQCSLAFKFNYSLKRHQQIHANGKLTGMKADSNGLFQCTHCIRRFTNVGNLGKHMKLHENGHRLYHCVRCLRRFGQKAKKEQHERQCEGRHFECHLCKMFVTKHKSRVQVHMRKHSGAKPFECMVCNKHFGQRSGLTAHLNRIHY